MESILPFLLSGAGGAVFGPILAKLLGGKGFGLIGNIITGLLGGVGANFGADQIPALAQFVGTAAEGGLNLNTILGNLGAGAAGGGILGAIAGLIKRA